MTIKWVKLDPLVMNGEPFCYGTRLTVRNAARDAGQRLRRRARSSRPPRAAADRHRRGLPLRGRPSGALRGLLRDGRRRCSGPGYTAAEAAGLPASTCAGHRRQRRGRTRLPPDHPHEGLVIGCYDRDTQLRSMPIRTRDARPAADRHDRRPGRRRRRLRPAGARDRARDPRRASGPWSTRRSA